MKKFTLPLSLSLLLVCATTLTAYATNYYSGGNNDPTVFANWWTNTNTTGSHPANFTTVGDIFTIQNGHTMTATADWNISVTVEIKSGGTLAISTFAVRTLSSLTLENGGTTGASITGSGVLMLGGNVTVNYTGSGSGYASIACPVALGATCTFTVADNTNSSTDLLVSGTISGASSGLTKAGAGTMVLTGDYPPPISANGGTITTSPDGAYTIHTFNSGDTFTPTASGNVEVLVVAGGGSSGSSYDSNGGAGGGGAGGSVHQDSHAVTAQSYTITVGAGGTPPGSGNYQGNNGNNSVFDGVTATGGGGGGSGGWNYSNSLAAGKDGGCGGGAGYNVYTYAAPGTGSQGFNGGTNGYTSGAGGGGGGGMGTAGHAPTNSPLHNGGLGGDGVLYNISGGSVTYAAGGKGGDESSTSGSNGAANTGNGGNANYASGTPCGAGGSGVVIIRYLTPFSGPVLISAGTLQVGNNTSTGTLGTGNITNNATLTYYRSDDISISNTISGTGALIKLGAGALTLSGANTYTGATTVTTGTLKAGVASVANTSGAFGNNSDITLANTSGVSVDITGFNTQIGSITGGGTNGGNVTLGAATLTVGGTTSPAAYEGIISGTGALIRSGTGTLTLSGSNTYSGLTTISAGIIKLGATGDGTNTPLGTTGSGTTVSATGAALDLNGFTLGTTEALTLNGTGVSSGGALMNSGAAATYSGLITLGSASSIDGGTGTINVSNAGTITGSGYGLTLGGAQGGTLASILGTVAGTLTKADGGTWTLSGSNTFTGGVTINAGILQLGNAGALNTTTPNAVTFSASSTGKLQLNGNSVTISGLNTNATIGTPVIEDGASGTHTLTLNSTGTNIYEGILQNGSAGTLAIIKNGSGTLTLDGTNTYTGGTTLNAGTLNINSTQALGTSAATFTIAGGTIDATTAGITTVAYPLALNADFTFTGTNSLNLGAGTVTMNADRNITVTANTLTIGGTINQSTRSLTKSGSSGTLSFGSSAVTLNGLTISAGTLASTSNTLSLAGNFSNSGAFTNNSGTVNFNGTAAQVIGGANATSFNNVTVSNTSAAISVNTNANIAGTLNMSGSATKLTPAAAVVFNSAGAAGTITGSGTVQVTRTAATADYSSQYKFTTNTLTNLTVEYTVAGGGQTVSGITYGTLTLDNTSGNTNTAGGNVSVTTLNNTGGGILDMLTSTLTVTTPNNTGTIRTQNTSGTPISTGKTWGGTVEYYGTGQVISTGTYNNLINSTGTNNANGAITASTLTVSSGVLNVNSSDPNLTTTNTLTVSLGALLNVNPGGRLTATTTTTINQDQGLVVVSNASGTGSFITGAQNGGGTAEVQRYFTTNKWHYSSIPISSATAAVFHLSSGQSDVYLAKWNPTIANGGSSAYNLNWDYITSTSTALTPGLGYAVWASSKSGGVEQGLTSATVNFTGSLNTAGYSVICTNSDASHGNGYYFVGNKFTSALDHSAGGWTYGGTLDGSVHVYENGTTHRLENNAVPPVGNLTGHIIPIEQGFFVQFVPAASSGTGSLSVPAGAKAHSSQAYYKTDDIVPDLVTLKISSEINSYTDEAFVYFKAGCTTGSDINEDAGKMFNITTSPDIYSISDGVNRSINALPELTDTAVVQLGYRVGINGAYQITAGELSSFPPGTSIYLEDQQTQVFQDMNENNVYPFTGDTTDSPLRFKLHFNSVITSIGEQNRDNLHVYTEGSTIYVFGLENIKEISVYDLLGQELLSMRPDGSRLQKLDMKHAQGIYIVKVLTSTHSYTKKVILN